MNNPYEYSIKEINKFEGRTKENLDKVTYACFWTGVFAAATITFAALGLNSVAQNQFIGKSLGYGVLTLLSTSFATFAYGKARKYVYYMNNKIDIYSDMAENQFVQKLEK